MSCSFAVSTLHHGSLPYLVFVRHALRGPSLHEENSALAIWPVCLYTMRTLHVCILCMDSLDAFHYAMHVHHEYLLHTLDYATVNTSLLGGICFFPGRRQVSSVERAHLFFLASRVCFSGPVFFFLRPAGKIFWLGPGRETNNQIHVPL